MGIVAEDVARVRAASDLVAIASEHIALKRVGRQYQGLCPFHAEKSPSFSVNPALGVYYCFGCQKSGDAITFLREVEHLDFAEAVERLAGRAGITLRYEDVSPGAAAERKRLAALRDAMARAVDWYHERLLEGRDAAAARHYLRNERGYDGDVVRAYKLGWGSDGLSRALGLPESVLREVGLGGGGSSFRGRLLFPIFDAKGDPVAFGGRLLPGSPPGPKYKNSPETPLYKKSRVLYGLNWAKGAAVAAAEVVICEGYTDVIGLHRAGVGQAVATCGTALGEEQVQTLKNFARRLVLAYDADAAGQAAAERVYEWERKHDIDVAVVALPGGLDPADVARRDPEGLRAAVAAAQPFLKFRLDRVLEAADVRSAEGRARAAEAALAVIAEHPNDLVRDQYVMEVERRTKIDHERLRERLRAGPAAAGPGAGTVAERQPLVRPAPLGRAEIEVLRVAVHQPEAVADRLHQALFGSSVGRRAYNALANAATFDEAVEGADEVTGALLRRVAVEEPRTDVDAAVAALVWAAVERVRPNLAEAEIPWVKATVEQLSEADTQRAAADGLVRWLVDREGT